MSQGYAAPIWMTRRQAQELSAQIRKGEKSTTVICVDHCMPKDQSDKPQDEQDQVRFWKGCAVCSRSSRSTAGRVISTPAGN